MLDEVDRLNNRNKYNDCKPINKQESISFGDAMNYNDEISKEESIYIIKDIIECLKYLSITKEEYTGLALTLLNVYNEDSYHLKFKLLLSQINILLNERTTNPKVSDLTNKGRLLSIHSLESFILAYQKKIDDFKIFEKANICTSIISKEDDVSNYNSVNYYVRRLFEKEHIKDITTSLKRIFESNKFNAKFKTLAEACFLAYIIHNQQEESRRIIKYFIEYCLHTLNN